MKIKYTANIIFIAVFLLCFNGLSYGQSRTYIKDCIKRYNDCRNVAITRTNGDLMLYGKNGWAASGCPVGLTNAIKALHDNNEYIDDIQLTEQGRWLILYGNNGMQWNDIPYSLERKLREFNGRGDVVTSVTFNDAGNWIIISTDYYSSSDTWIQEWLKEGAQKFGLLYAACITDDAIVAVYQGGYKFYGNVPQSLKDALNRTRINVYRLKIAGGSWFFADYNGFFDYYM